jgi:THO complex subunit 2
LDIILDVLSQHLTSHYSFFLALLSYSPWSGSYRRRLPEKEALGTNTENIVESHKGMGLDDVLTLAEANSVALTTGMPGGGGGARVLAQVLGFKFSYYQVRPHAHHVLSLTKCSSDSGSLRAHPAYSLPDCRHSHP